MVFGHKKSGLACVLLQILTWIFSGAVGNCWVPDSYLNKYFPAGMLILEQKILGKDGPGNCKHSFIRYILNIFGSLKSFIYEQIFCRFKNIFEAYAFLGAKERVMT